MQTIDKRIEKQEDINQSSAAGAIFSILLLVISITWAEYIAAPSFLIFLYFAGRYIVSYQRINLLNQIRGVK